MVEVKTLAELRAMTTPKLPTRVERICLNFEVLGQVEQLQNEKQGLLVEAMRSQPTDEGEERKGPPRKLAEPAKPPRVVEIDAELEVLYDAMREYEGDLELHGIDGGTWVTWKDEHPPREGNKADEDLGYGLVDTTALLQDLGRYAYSWDGDPFKEGDWHGWFASRVASADLAVLVKRVVEMQEGRVSVPKALSDSSAPPSPESADDSPST